MLVRVRTSEIATLIRYYFRRLFIMPNFNIYIVANHFSSCLTIFGDWGMGRIFRDV